MKSLFSVQFSCVRLCRLFIPININIYKNKIDRDKLMIAKLLHKIKSDQKFKNEKTKMLDTIYFSQPDRVLSHHSNTVESFKVMSNLVHFRECCGRSYVFSEFNIMKNNLYSLFIDTYVQTDSFPFFKTLHSKCI